MSEREWIDYSVTGRETFPVQAETTNRERYPRTTIPWWLAEIAYREYVRRYGGKQSLQRLAERGGFGREELLDLLGQKELTNER